MARVYILIFLNIEIEIYNNWSRGNTVLISFARTRHNYRTINFSDWITVV